MIESLLIANRGEIARRIQRTCRDMGIRTLAVFSDADRNLPGIGEADRAVRLGAGPAAESYLDLEHILAIAKGNGVHAIHPGYGFLSENARFAEACQERGIIFVGPPPEAIRAMGDKSEAKRRMAAAGVPVLPGYLGESQDAATLAREAERIGYPLLVKAVSGGGGRGIRLVERAEDLDTALESARREAQSAFKDGRLMLERYLPEPHHIEFQVLADSHGSVLHLFERECSIQRRHQKIVEETPSPALTQELRLAMADAAVSGARAIGYVGAGTMEFLVDGGGGFYFLEMNTRLQVEHPVTEMTLGVDLVRLQIEVAEGRPLSLRQEHLVPRGHAIECRLNAENPARRFLPSVGRIERFSFPEYAGLRVDTGFAAGSDVSPFYDSLLAKLIAWGSDRQEALRRMRRMLETSEVAGLATNLPILQGILAQEEFAGGHYTTHFMETHETELLKGPSSQEQVCEQVLSLCAVEVFLGMSSLPAQSEPAKAAASPWATECGLRHAAGVVPLMRRVFVLGATEHTVTIRAGLGADTPESGVEERDLGTCWIAVEYQEASYHLRAHPTAVGRLQIDLGGMCLPVNWYATGSERWLTVGGTHVQALCRNPAEHVKASAEEGAERLQAPLPGKIVKLTVQAGQRVKAGEMLLLLEAMKVEHQITSPGDGIVKTVHFREGDQVQRGAQLIELDAE
jgi:3-methylcrotonyl-CoA carboxylase alpha subunit